MTPRRDSGVLAVLFTDLVGSTELMVRLGDAAFDELRGEHFARLREVVAAHGGSEVKNTGDGVMATFPSAVAALAAAAAAQETTEHQARSAPGPMSLRVGLAIGEVAFEDGDVFGTPVVEAARLVAAAGSGQILATALVRTMAGSRAPTRFTDLGRLELKGLPQPVPVCQADWKGPADPPASAPAPVHLSQGPGGQGEGVPLVGRQELVDRLGVALDAARAGAGRLVLLTGEPGIGKTALAREVAAHAGENGFGILWGTCWDGEGTPPFWPWVEALRSALRHLDPEEREALITASGEEIARLLPEFTPGRPAPSRGTEDGDGARFRLFDGVSSLLSRLAERCPLLVVLDDLHWADPSSVGLLRFVAARARLAPILFLCAYRDVEITRDHPLRTALGELGTLADSLPVPALDQSGVRALLEQVCGASLEDELVETAYRRTAGNPFFVGEVGRLMGSDNHGIGASTRMHSATSIPEGVRSVVERRLARLSQACHNLLGIAAVVGQEADVSLLASVSDLPEPVIDELLGEAGQARVTLPSASALPGVRFTHDLFRETLYDGLAGSGRLEAHRRIALALEQRRTTGSAVSSAELAHHVLRGSRGADDRVRAARYSLEAARDALGRLALRDGLVHAERALTTLEQLASPDEEDMLEALLVLAETERRAGELERARRTYARAAALARGFGASEELARAALGVHQLGGDYGEAHESTRALLEEAALALVDADGTTKARVLAALARQCYHDRQRGSLDPRRLAEQAVDVAGAAGDPATLAFALWAQYDTAWEPGSARRRAEIAERMEAVAVAAGDLELRAQGRLLRAIARLELAEPGAVADFECYSGLAQELREPVAHYLALTRQVTVATMQGDLDEAEQLMEEAALLGEAIGEPDRWNVENVEVWALRSLQDRRPEVEERMRSWPHPIFAAWYGAKVVLCMVARGATEEAAAALAEFEDYDPATQPLDNIWLSQVGTIAEAAAAVGHRPLAARLYEALLPFAGSGLITAGAVDFSGAVDHYLGLLAATLGRSEAAASHFQAAVSVHRRLGALPWIARSNRELAALTAGAAALEGGEAPAPRRGTFSRVDDVWTLDFAGKEVRLKDAKGLRDIAVLLGAPGRPVSAGTLLGTQAGEEAAEEAALGADPVLDDRARAEYRNRLRELDEDLAEAEANHDLERLARARLERELLAEELAGAVGLGGRSRLLGGGGERARKAVTARMRNTLRRIEERHAELGAHLAEAITTGTSCSYSPSQPVEWRL